MIFDEEYLAELRILRGKNRLRETRALGGGDRTHPTIGGVRVLAFCSNDYLGLSSHPDVKAAMARGCNETGAGAGASRLISGTTLSHQDLEAQLATALDCPGVLVYPTGYQANLGALTALARAGDLIASDSANHASIIDGCRLSRATVAIFAHASASAADAALATPGDFLRRFLVTESVFSMDGDSAPLRQLAAVAQRRGAALYVDEAHAIGATGPNGRGLAAECGVEPDVLVGTLGKALGAFGGFVAGSTPLREMLVNGSRPFIYTTAFPAALAAAARAGLAIATSHHGQSLRDHAHRLASVLRGVLAQRNIPTRGEHLIVPIILKSEEAALRVSAALLDRGILVPAIRPPTVPAGTSRLRVTISAAHTEAEVLALADALGEIIRGGTA